MSQAKRCKCGQVLLPGESHDCPVHRRHVRYADNAIYFADAATILSFDAGDSGSDLLGDVADSLGDFIGDILS